MPRNVMLRQLIRGVMFAGLLIFMAFQSVSFANDLDEKYFERVCSAIYWAEGGTKTRHPYGILKKYKTTTPKAACLNTVRHAWKDWNGEGDFIAFIGSRYCPVGSDTDNGTCRYWVKNVKALLAKN